MTAKFFSCLIAALLSTAAISHATIRFVSPNPGSAPFTSIATAYNTAVSGDTIVLGPGTYTESFGIAGKKIHFIGAGWDVCTWNGYVSIYYAGSTGTVFEGIRFPGGGYFTIYPYSDVDSVTVRRCNVSGASGYSPLYLNAGKVFVSDCVLSAVYNSCAYIGTLANGNVIFRNTVFNLTTPSTAYSSMYGPNGATVEIYNCVFLNFSTIFNVTGIPQVIGLNNIFWDWGASPSFGTLPVGSVFEYSAAGSDAPAWPANFTNNINLGGNNPFVNYATDYYEYGVSNLHLNALTGGLMCVDAGYPTILDLDSTASDLGIYGGPKPFVDHGVPAFPFAVSLNIDNLVEVGDSVNVVSSGRIGPRY